MKDMRIRKMVFAALMAALTYVATMVVQIPSPMQGFVNLGDCCVLLSGWMLGPWWGGAAAGIGSMLTDLLNGYAHYAPGTFVIKGCMAIAAALLAKAMGNKSAGYAVSGVVAEVIMVAGYFGYAALLLGKGIGAAGGHGSGDRSGAFLPAQAQQGTGQTGSAVIHCAYEQTGRGEAPVGRCFVG